METFDVMLFAALGVNVLFTLALVVLAAVRSPEALSGPLRDELRAGRGEAAGAARQLREEVAAALDKVHGTLDAKLARVIDGNEKQIEALRAMVEKRLTALQDGNEKKLEQMRETVDEKLQGTLEKRLGESFQLVSARLEAVQKGLGEMRTLATGVGDLKKVLTNVKARGTWGEVQLGAILEEMLTPDQYEKNVQPRSSSRETVEYAIRLPGAGAADSSVWLPIDAKLPQEDYQRLVDAIEAGDADAAQRATAGLVRALHTCAKDINTKYLHPPATTDFGIMFLPTEGLYSEVLRQPGLVENLQQMHRVVVAGPTTLSAILSSLRMGFRTLAIEKRSSEVWKVLAGVKNEFGKFGNVLDKLGKQLDTARKTVDQTGTRTRAIERSLRAVETTEAVEAVPIDPLFDLNDADDADEPGDPKRLS